ncbi:MAG: DMT family transporter [Pseudomonadota bacterium]
MPTHVILIVLGAALLHASWNAMAKGRAGGDPLASMMAIALAGGAIAIPLLAVTGLPGPPSYAYVLASGVVHVIYFLLVGLAYRHGAYSTFYPLTRGSAPLLTALMGSVLLGEPASPAMIGGVVLLSVGVLGLGLDALAGIRPERRAVLAAALNVAVIVGYTILDGVGARLSGNPAGYVVAMMALTGLMLLAVVPLVGSASIGAMLAARPAFAFTGGAMIMASYGIALWAMTRAPIGAVAALRETSALFGTIISALFLREQFGCVRWVAAAAITAGLVLIRLG